jgi:hypothetical protein
MLNLPALSAMVKKEAAKSAFRMLDSFKPNTGNIRKGGMALGKMG